MHWETMSWCSHRVTQGKRGPSTGTEPLHGTLAMRQGKWATCFWLFKHLGNCCICVWRLLKKDWHQAVVMHAYLGHSDDVPPWASGWHCCFYGCWWDCWVVCAGTVWLGQWCSASLTVWVLRSGGPHTLGQNSNVIENNEIEGLRFKHTTPSQPQLLYRDNLLGFR